MMELMLGRGGAGGILAVVIIIVLASWIVGLVAAYSVAAPKGAGHLALFCALLFGPIIGILFAALLPWPPEGRYATRRGSPGGRYRRGRSRRRRRRSIEPDVRAGSVGYGGYEEEQAG